jgi:hypothetical protein
MGVQVVESIFNADGTRRVDIYERGDGTFGFEEFRFGEEEQGWLASGCRATSFTDNLGDALREARGRVWWLAQGEDQS